MPLVQVFHRPPLSGSGGEVKSCSHQVLQTGVPRSLVVPLHFSRMDRAAMALATVALRFWM